jgi:predicted RNA-binding protein with PUA-like domain
MPRKYWLMKCELEACSFDELKNDRPNSTGKWRGVRNYQARNSMRDDMKVGDLVLFYQSNCDAPGIPGLAEIVRAGYPDPSAFDPEDPYHDPKSNPDEPTWYSVDVKWKQAFKTYVSLKDLKANPKLKDMKVVQRFQRLSVQPVTKRDFDIVRKMGGL